MILMGAGITAIGFMIGGYTGMALPFWIGVGLLAIGILRKVVKRRRTYNYAYNGSGESF